MELTDLEVKVPVFSVWCSSSTVVGAVHKLVKFVWTSQIRLYPGRYARVERPPPRRKRARHLKLESDNTES